MQYNSGDLVLVCVSGRYVRFSSITEISASPFKDEEAMVEKLQSTEPLEHGELYIEHARGRDALSLLDRFNMNSIGIDSSIFMDDESKRSILVRAYFVYKDTHE